MVKLTNQEIADRLNLEDDSLPHGTEDAKQKSEEDTEMQDAEFYFNETYAQMETIKDREILEQGTSYNEHMLDLNELAEKDLIGRGTKINLSDMPEIDTLQASTEEQLLMIMPKNRKQITAIHLSNNTPVDRYDDYEYHNTQKLDETMDLTSFSSLEKFETHFYLNDDLKNVKLPDSVTAVKFQRSKMENLDIMEQFDHCNIAFSNAQTKKIIDDEEFEKVCSESRFENRENNDGTYNIYDKENDRIVADHLTGEKLQLTSPQKTNYAQKYYNDITYYEYLCDCEVFGIKDDTKKYEDALILTDGKLYKPERDNPEFLEPTGSPEWNIPIDVIKLTNISNKNDVRYTLQSFEGFECMGSNLGRQSRDSGTCIATSRYDNGRGFARRHALAFKSDDKGYIDRKLVSIAKDCGRDGLFRAINDYFEQAEKKNIDLSKDDIKKKIAVAIKAGAPLIGQYDSGKDYDEGKEKYYNDWVSMNFVFCEKIKPCFKALVKATEGTEMKDFFRECGVGKEAINDIIDNADKAEQHQLAESKIQMLRQRINNNQDNIKKTVQQTEMPDAIKQKFITGKQNS